MKQYYTYTVAGHTFGLEVPDDISVDEVLASYLPFFTKVDRDAEPIFILHVDKNDILPENKIGGRLLYKGDMYPYLWIYRNEKNYIFGFSMTLDVPGCLLFVSPSFREAKLYIRKLDIYTQIAFALHSSLMLLYALNTANKKTLIVHAAAVEFKDRAYMFLGLSGTGKSTHARLWLKHVKGSELLNDDTPVLRIEEDGTVLVYGSPWSGKTACYKNRCVELGAVVRLSQAPYNQIKAMTQIEAYASLLPSCSCMKWVRKMADGVHNSIEQVVARSTSYHLECLPDKEAALLCAKTVKAI